MFYFYIVNEASTAFHDQAKTVNKYGDVGAVEHEDLLKGHLNLLCEEPSFRPTVHHYLPCQETCLCPTIHHNLSGEDPSLSSTVHHGVHVCEVAGYCLSNDDVTIPSVRKDKVQDVVNEEAELETDHLPIN